MMAIVNRIRAITPMEGPNIKPNITELGTVLNFFADSIGAGKRHPYEVGIISYYDSTNKKARVRVAWGTVRDVEEVTKVVTIDGLNDTFDVEKGDVIWIEANFDTNGKITSCYLRHGSVGLWAQYPNEYVNAVGGNRWNQLIAHVRQSLKLKDTKQYDSGEEPLMEPELTIAQCTNFHLVTQRRYATLGSGTTNVADGFKLIAGAGGAIEGPIVSAGTLTFSGTTNSLGKITMKDGGSIDSSVANLTNATNNQQNWNGSFTFTGTNSLNIGTGTVTLGANTTVTVAANTFTVGGIIEGGYSVVKSGAGTLALTSDASTYTGTTTVTQGTLSVKRLYDGGVACSLGMCSAAAANLLLGNGTTLKYTGTGDSTNRLFTINATSSGHGATLDASGSGAVAFTNTGSLEYGTTNQTRTLTLAGTNTGANSFSPLIANNGGSATSLVKDGAGKWILPTANTYTGTTTINDGTLVITATIAGATNITITGGVLQVGNGGTVGELGSAAVTNNATITYNRSNTLIEAHVIGGTGNLIHSGSGTLVLTATNTYDGTTTISGGGTLQIGNTGTTGTLGDGAVVNNGALTFKRTDNITIANSISGTGTFKKYEGNTLVIGGTGTYTGDTTIYAGRLELANAIASSIIVTSGTSLGGGNGVTATANNLTVNTGGTLSCGDEASTYKTGALTFLGNVTFDASSDYTFKFNSDNTSADQITVVGSVTVGAGTTLTVIDLGGTGMAGLVGQSAVVISYSTTWSGWTFGGIANRGQFTTADATYQIDYNGLVGTPETVMYITIVSVP
jgi:fibronectin-binding autotransporter adhesin